MLFVYGTLRKGGRNRHLVDQDVKSTTTALATGTLFIHGRSAFFSSHGNTKIAGELLHLFDENEVLGRLDEFEGPEYKRRAIEVVTEEGRECAWAYLYFSAATPRDATIIRDGDWIAYCSKRSLDA